MCRTEFEAIRNYKIKDTWITYFIAILTEPPDLLARCARNKKVREELENNNYQTAYIYTSDL